MDWNRDLTFDPIMTLNRVEKLCCAQAFSDPTPERTEQIKQELLRAKQEIDYILKEIES